MKVSKIILLPLFILSCVNSNLPQNNNTPSPSISNSIKPSISVTPTISASPSISPTPSNKPTESIINKEFNLGLFRTFSRITDDKSPDKILDQKNTTNIINDLYSNSIVIDFNQNLIDKDLDGDIEDDIGDLNFYKELIESFKDKKIYFRVKYNQLPSLNTTPKMSEFLSYFDKVNEKLKVYENISWIIEDKINNKNLNPEPESQLVDFVKKASALIKKHNKDSKVYLGSLMQSELFSQRVSYTADNLLNYLNLGIADSCDGFILELYNVLSPNSYLPSDYKVISNYYNLIKNTLKLNSIENKEIFLITSTYNGSILSRQEEDKDEDGVFYNIGDFQSEQQQSGLIVRNIIYGLYSGFDYIFLPKIFDDEHEAIIEVIKKSGLIDEVPKTEKDLTIVRKKVSYWSIKFLNKILSGTKLIKKINVPYSGIEVFLFESSNKYFYVVWNDINERNDTINIPLENTKGTIYVLPYDNNNKEGSPITFSLDKKELGISFSRNAYIPRIIEVEK